MDELIEKAIRGERLTDREWDDLTFETKVVAENEYDESRWHIWTQTVFEYNGKYYAFDWGRDKTEMGEHNFWDCKLYEVKKVTKVVEVTDWVAIDG
jgi:hypothetical protein